MTERDRGLPIMEALAKLILHGANTEPGGHVIPMEERVEMQQVFAPIHLGETSVSDLVAPIGLGELVGSADAPLCSTCGVIMVLATNFVTGEESFWKCPNCGSKFVATTPIVARLCLRCHINPPAPGQLMCGGCIVAQEYDE